MAKRRRRNRARVFDDVRARAARLGITEERLLEECRRIAFSNISHIVEWTETGKLKMRNGLQDEQLAAIAEIVASAGNQTIYRIKLHDKKPVLELLGRCLDMLPRAQEAPDDDPDAPLTVIENPREFILHELDLADTEDAARACQKSER